MSVTIPSQMKIQNVDNLLIQVEAEECRRSLKTFVQAVWHIIEPAKFVSGLPLDVMIDHLEAVTHGDIRKLVINIPPRHTKSTLLVIWRVWTWLQNPSERFLCASYSLDLSTRDNLRVRRIIEDPWFQAHYGNLFQLAGDQNIKRYFENTERGYQMALSVNGGTTGQGGSVLVIDDCHNADEAHSEKERSAALMWFREVWTNRLNDQERDKMVVVGQRIHDEDVCGYILKERPDWIHLNLPAYFEPDRRCVTPIWSDPRTEEGELLWPERFSQSVLEGLRRDLGSMGFAAQYQQRPVPAGGAIFKKQWFRYFTETSEAYLLETPQGTRSVLKSDCWRFTVVDLAISSKQTADYTVIQTYDVTPHNDLLLIEQIRDHLDNPQQQKVLRLLYHRLKPRFIKVESVGYQLALIQELRNEPKNVTDFLVTAASPEALDRTLQQLPGIDACLLRDGNEFTGPYTQYRPDVYIARVLGDVGFFKFAVEHQCYCRIVGQPGVDSRKVSIPVREYKPVRDKVARATTPAIWMENGKFFFRQGDPYLATVEPELLMFPLGGHDDIVDDCSMAADEVATGVSMQALIADLDNRQTAKEAVKETIQKQRNDWYW